MPNSSCHFLCGTVSKGGTKGLTGEGCCFFPPSQFRRRPPPPLSCPLIFSPSYRLRVELSGVVKYYNGDVGLNMKADELVGSTSEARTLERRGHHQMDVPGPGGRSGAGWRRGRRRSKRRRAALFLPRYKEAAAAHDWCLSVVYVELG